MQAEIHHYLRVEYLIQKLREEVDDLRHDVKHFIRKGEQFMATTAEILKQIDDKTTQIGTTVTEEVEDLAAVKKIIEDLKAQLDPGLQAAAQAALDKLTGVGDNLTKVAADLDATGKGGVV